MSRVNVHCAFLEESKSKISNFVGTKFAAVPLCALEEVQCLCIASRKLPVNALQFQMWDQHSLAFEIKHRLLLYNLTVYML